MEDLKSLVRKLQESLQEMPDLLARAETMSLAEAEDLSTKLFASARDLTAVAGAVVANSARKVSCSCVQGASIPAKESLPESLPPSPATQRFHETCLPSLTSKRFGIRVNPCDGKPVFESSEAVSRVLTFDDLGLKGDLLRGIYTYNVEKPSAILIAQGQSGLGKTATSISILQSIDVTVRVTQALVLSPTRQSATRIQSMMLALGDYIVHCHSCIAGTSIGEDIRKLDYDQHVVSGAPGHVFDMIRKSHLKTHNIKIFVLDEADVLLNKDFKDQLYNVYRYLPPATQVVLLSTTFPNNVLEMSSFFATKFLTNPICILVEHDQLIPEGTKQFFVTIEEDRKFDTLCDLLDTLTIKKAIIFCNTRSKVDRLTHEMWFSNFTVSSFHNEMIEKERDANMAEFQNGTSRVLVTTDPRTRGIDFLVSLVINYDIPADPETYLHRIGRSGRFGCKGVAISLATDDDVRILRNIEQYYSTQIDKMPANVADFI